jgi:hypothetical protein
MTQETGKAINLGQAKKSFWCRIGIHNYKDLVKKGMDLFLPTAPSIHIQECTRCRQCRRIGYTYYGSVVYYYKDRNEAGVLRHLQPELFQIIPPIPPNSLTQESP